MSRSKEYAERKRVAKEFASDPEAWQAIKNGNAGVRDKMVTIHYFLLEAVAVTLKKNLPEHIHVEDLMSYGSLGLMRAVDTFDAERANFDTHAVICIRGKILDELRAIDWAPKSLRRKVRDMGKAAAILRRTLQREPTDEELASFMEVSVESINATRLAERQSTHKSFEDMHPHMQVQRQDDVSTAQAGPEELALVYQCQHLLVGWYRELSVDEKVIIALYYYRDYNLSQIARETGWSEAKVVTTHTRLITDLRGRLLETIKDGSDTDAARLFTD